MFDPDTALLCLRVLAINASNGPITTELVALGYEARLHKPAVRTRIEQALLECVHQRWALRTEDEWGQDVWSITLLGKERNSQS